MNRASAPRPLFDRMLLGVYLVLLFFAITLPSGYVVGFNLKIATFAATVFCIVLYFLLHVGKRFSRRFVLTFVVTLLTALLFMLGSLFVGVLNAQTELSYSVDAFRNIFSAFALVFVTYLLYALNLLSFGTFLRAALVFNLAFSLIKLLLAATILLGLITIAQVEAVVERVLNYQVITLQILGNLYRFQFINDTLTPFLLFFLLMSPRLGVRLSPRYKVFYLAVSALSIFLTFSRFIWLLALMAVLIYLITANSKKLALATLAAGVCLMVAVNTGELQGYLQEVVRQRFAGEGVSQADSVRLKQATLLTEEMAAYPILGKGLGSYTDELIRDVAAPYSYEVQWLAFGLQFGVVGLVVLALYMFAVIYRLLFPRLNRAALAILVMYGLWLLSGFTNPYLGSSVGGIVFALFYLSAVHLGRLRLAQPLPVQQT